MVAESIDERVEGVRAVLWAMARLLEREDMSARAALFELKSLAQAGLQLADDYLDSTSTEPAFLLRDR